jgi:hypothetical protein
MIGPGAQILADAEVLIWAARRLIASGFPGISIMIPKRVRVLDGVTDPPGDFRKNLLSARNGISQIAEVCYKDVWLPERV